MLPNNSLQRTALSAAADAGRYAARSSRKPASIAEHATASDVLDAAEHVHRVEN